MFSSIHLSSISSCSGLNPTAPSTPNPPALLTATTTSRQWVNAKIGYSMPRSLQIGVRMPAPWVGRSRIRTCSSLAHRSAPRRETSVVADEPLQRRSSAPTRADDPKHRPAVFGGQRRKLRTGVHRSRIADLDHQRGVLVAVGVEVTAL